MRPIVLATAAALFGLLGVWAASKALRSPAPRREAPPQSPGVFVSPPRGFRRARQSEVTPQMQAKAVETLPRPLGTLSGPFANEGGVLYLVAIETHSNAPKGASVFIEELA